MLNMSSSIAFDSGLCNYIMEKIAYFWINVKCCDHLANVISFSGNTHLLYADQQARFLPVIDSLKETGEVSSSRWYSQTNFQPVFLSGRFSLPARRHHSKEYRGNEDFQGIVGNMQEVLPAFVLFV